MSEREKKLKKVPSEGELPVEGDDIVVANLATILVSGLAWASYRELPDHPLNIEKSVNDAWAILAQSRRLVGKLGSCKTINGTCKVIQNEGTEKCQR